MDINCMAYRSYKEQFEIYTQIHGSIAIDSCHLELIKRYKIVPEDDT